MIIQSLKKFEKGLNEKHIIYNIALSIRKKENMTLFWE